MGVGISPPPSKYIRIDDSDDDDDDDVLVFADAQGLEFASPNDDLIIEILKLLPAKPVLRFKCVSKGWQSIISDVSFRSTHSQKSKPIISGFFFQEKFQWCNDDIELINYISVDSERSSTFNTILNFLPEKVVLMASSNGLLCCRSCIKVIHPVIYICNPCNKEYIKLEWEGRTGAESVALAFDPFQIGIGVSSSFKLVSLSRTEEEDIEPYFSFRVYCSTTKKWKLIEKICYCDFPLSKNKGVFANGQLHWLTSGDKILIFDVENEQSCLIDVPPRKQCKCVPEMCIGESNGKLHYIRISEAGLEDWILTDASEPEWLLMHSVSLKKMEQEYPDFLFNIEQRVTSRISEDVRPLVNPLAFKDDLLFIFVCSKVYSYSFESRKLATLCNLESLGPNAIGSPIVLPYSMSLVPLEHPIIVLA